MPSTYERTRETLPTDTSTDRRVHFYARGELIPTEMEGMWQVCQGLVQLGGVYASGEEAILGWIGSSMWFGSLLTYLQSYQAKALSGVYLMWYSHSEIESSPEIAQSLLPQLSQRLRQAEALLAIAGHRRVEHRTIELLLLLQREFGQPWQGGTRLTLRLTHQDLANAIGTSRVTMTRLLGKFKQEGKITFDRDRHIIICSGAFGDRAGLLKI